MKINWTRLLVALSAIAYCQALYMTCRALQARGYLPPGNDQIEAVGLRVMFVATVTMAAVVGALVISLIGSWLTSGHEDSPASDDFHSSEPW